MSDEVRDIINSSGDEIELIGRGLSRSGMLLRLGLLIAIFLLGITTTFPIAAQDVPTGATNREDTGGNSLPGPWVRYQIKMARRERLQKLWESELRGFRTVDPVDLASYKSFLDASKTGIFRLLPNFDCVTKGVIKVDGECTGYVPESSDFSFRTKKYADPQDHDIGYIRDEFVSNAIFSQGVLVSLGDIPIEDLTVDSKGLRFLTGFKPDEFGSAARDHALQFERGVQTDGFTYIDHVKARSKTTYGLRLIGYRYKYSMPSNDTSLFETNLAELDFFERREILIVFRVIRRDDHGNLTIVWKELGNKKAPKLKFAKGEKRYDFSKQ